MIGLQYLQSGHPDPVSRESVGLPCSYPEYESNFGIDHLRIVDLLQVFDISCTVQLSGTSNERCDLKVAASRDPDCAVDHLF